MPREDLTPLLERVRQLHERNGFAQNGGEDHYFRMALIAEEVGEICRCLTTGTGDLAQEHADLLIVLLGNSISFGIDVIDAAHRKLDQLEHLTPRVVDGHARLVTRDSPCAP